MGHKPFLVQVAGSKIVGSEFVSSSSGAGAPAASDMLEVGVGTLRGKGIQVFPVVLFTETDVGSALTISFVVQRT